MLAGKTSYQFVASARREPDLTRLIGDSFANPTARARGRPVAVCWVDGRDVGELQVLAGHARDCPRFSEGRYSAAEAEAIDGGHILRAIYPLPSYCLDR